VDIDFAQDGVDALAAAAPAAEINVAVTAFPVVGAVRIVAEEVLDAQADGVGNDARP
jgi:hypothetical protein